MNNQRNNNNFITRLKKIKKTRALISALLPPFGLFMLIFVVIICVVVISQRVPESIFSIFGMDSGNHSSIVEAIDNRIADWSDDEKLVFSELNRQKQIWDTDYPDYNTKKNVIVNYENNNLNIVKYIAAIQYKLTKEMQSNDEIKNDNDILFNEDARQYYSGMGKKIGSVFFLYPGQRQLIGNSISASIKYNVVHPKYSLCNDGTGNYCLQNLDEILSDWQALGNMYFSSEDSLKQYYNSYLSVGPQQAVNNLVSAINFGYETCIVNGFSAKNDWESLNICHDYKQIFMDNRGYLTDYNRYYSIDLFQKSISEKYNNVNVELPIYEYDPSGKFSNSNIRQKIPANQLPSETSRNFISVSVQRDYSESLYNDYLNNVYIPAIYINCSYCKDNDVASVLQGIKQLENIYNQYGRTLSNENLTGGSYETAGSKKIEVKNGSYTCDGVQIGISADYVGHKANDLYSGSTPTVFPLMEGTVVAVNSNCNTYCPKNDALSYVNRIRSLFQLSPACYCGGGWGNYVKIASQFNGKTIYATYAHLSSVAVTVGQNITYSTPLGIMGTTGVSTGKHLHIELNYTDSSSNKFPPTKLFSTKSVLSTICGGNGNEKEGEDTNE